MAAYPSPITAETFQDAWKCISRKRYWSIKKELIRRIGVTLAQASYFIVFAILSMGILYEMCGPLIRSYMDMLPQVGIWWGRIRELLLQGASSESARILRCLAVIYFLPFGVGSLVALLIGLLFHPQMPVQTGDLRQDAGKLQVMAKQAQAYAQKKENTTETTLAVFMGVLMATFVLGLMLFAYKIPALQAETMEKAENANLLCFLYGLAIFVCYRILNIPLKILLKVLHYCRVPAKMVTDTENYYVQVYREEKTAEDAKEEADRVSS